MLQIDDVIANRYKIEEFLKEGNATNLWQARDMILRRTVIVRIIREKMLDDSGYVKRFAQESQILAQLEHPHIIPIYDYGIHEKQPFQIQRFIGINDLLQWYWNQPKPVSSLILLRIIQQMADALDFIHQRGIVHRALRATTLIIDDKNQPYLINFILAKDLKNGTTLQEDDIRQYVILSPEEKGGAAVDIATDLYAFGLLVFSLFTGRREPKIRHNQVIDKVRDYRPDLPIGVDVVVSRLLHSDPKQRYTSVGEAVEDLYRAFYSGQSSIEGQIFISYARKDSEYVYTLAKELRQIGLDIWIDQDIEPGSNWDKTIEDALRDSEKMLLIVSPASMLSENVQDEWSYFLEEGKPVFPFIHQDCEMSFRLRRRQYITSTDDLLSDVARIVDVLAGGNPTKLNTFVDES